MNFKEYFEEAGGGGSAFKSREDAQRVADDLNLGKKGPFKPKDIGGGYWQLTYVTEEGSVLVEKNVPMKIFDRIFVMPGDKGESLVWMGHDLYKMKRSKEGELMASRKDKTEFKSIEMPIQFHAKNVKKAIDDSLSKVITEDKLRSLLTAGMLGASSLLGTGSKEMPREIEPAKLAQTANKKETEMSPVSDVNINPKMYSELLVKAAKDPVLYAIAKHESKFDPMVVGDKHLKDHAYGILQIRNPVLIDVNETFGTKYSVEDVVAHSMKKSDIERAVKNSLDVYAKYLQRYKMSGKPAEEIAKFWNGGPLSKKIGMIALNDVPSKYATYRKNIDKYWSTVETYLN